MQNKRREAGIVGKEKEQLAADFLKRNGMIILECNFRSRQGEIDLIGKHKGYLVFVEVKYRSAAYCGAPESAVTFVKQKKICQCADYYRLCHHCGDDTAFRYDVVAIEKDVIHWYENAFSHLQQT